MYVLYFRFLVIPPQKMLKFIFVTFVVLALAVLSDAKNVEDGNKEKAIGPNDGLLPEQKATNKTEEMMKSVEKQVLELLKLQGVENAEIVAVSFRSKKARFGWSDIITFVKVSFNSVKICIF